MLRPAASRLPLASCLPVEVHASRCKHARARLRRRRRRYPKVLGLFRLPGLCCSRRHSIPAPIIPRLLRQYTPLAFKSGEAALDWPRVNNSTWHAINVNELKAQATVPTGHIENAASATQGLDAIRVDEEAAKDASSFSLLLRRARGGAPLRCLEIR